VSVQPVGDSWTGRECVSLHQEAAATPPREVERVTRPDENRAPGPLRVDTWIALSGTPNHSAARDRFSQSPESRFRRSMNLPRRPPLSLARSLVPDAQLRACEPSRGAKRSVPRGIGMSRIAPAVEAPQGTAAIRRGKTGPAGGDLRDSTGSGLGSQTNEPRSSRFVCDRGPGDADRIAAGGFPSIAIGRPLRLVERSTPSPPPGWILLMPIRRGAFRSLPTAVARAELSIWTSAGERARPVGRIH